MANPNNLIRPPVLAAPPVPPNPHPSNDQLTATITEIVTNIFRTEGRNLVQATLNPNANFANLTDATIDPLHRNSISDLDKIPDVVRCLREFSGNPGEFNSWKKSIDRIMQIYEHQRGTPKYYGILNVIRNKIVGNADIALESYNTPLDWKAISRCLTLHYADKRDLGTLEYQMTSLVQGNLSIQEFYQQVYSHLSLILNKLGCMEVGAEAMNLLTRTYRDKALDTFIRGLRGDLPRLLGMREPADLPQALHLCLKLENQNFRSHYALNNQNQMRRYQDFKPSLPPRKFNAPPRPNREFYPQLAYMPQPRLNPINPYKGPQPNFQQQSQRPNNIPPRPFPKPQPRPEPMDVDPSMRTRNVNYMNRPRPNDFFGKRPPSHYPQNPQKVQRNFHINSDTTQDFDEEEYPQTLPDNNPSFNQNAIDHQYPYDESQHDDNIDITDLNFLD